MTAKYFAYGSNLDLLQMKKRCPLSKLISKGKLPDYRLTFNRYAEGWDCLLYTSPSPRDGLLSRMPSSA